MSEHGPSAQVLPALRELQGSESERLGQRHVTLPKSAVRDAVRLCRQAGFDQLVDVFGIDWLHHPRHQGPRFEVVYNLYSLHAGERLFLRVGVEDGESVPSIANDWPAANFMERETYDMYGVTFDGHPDLRKLLTPEDLDGYPLRKDFPIGETPTLFQDGRYLDPASFRAGMLGRDPGLTGWSGGVRRAGIRSGEGRHQDASRYQAVQRDPAASDEADAPAHDQAHDPAASSPSDEGERS